MLLADCFFEFASGMKPAAAGGRYRTGNVALDDSHFHSLKGIGGRNGTEKCLGIRMPRGGGEILFRADFQDFPQIHDGNLVTQETDRI